MTRQQIVSEAEAVQPRSGPAGGEAERQAHRGLAARLAAGGRATRLEPHWVRPRWELAIALHAAAGLAGGVVATRTPLVGLCIAAAALFSLLLDSSGRLALLRRLTPERATQNVVAGPPPGTGGEVRLLLTAHCDAPRGGAWRAGRPWRLATAGVLGLGPQGWLALGLLAVVGCAAARLAGAGGSAIGAAQLVPTVGLVGALWLCVDAALAAPPEADGSAAAAVAEIAAALAAAPPRVLAVEVVVAGAGEAGALGFLAHLRAHRPARDRVVVVEIAGGEDGPPRWWRSDGSLLPLRFHPRLVALCREVAGRERHLRAAGRRGREVGAALRARQRGLPAIRIGGGAPSATVELALALIDALDGELERERVRGVSRGRA